MLPAVSSVSSTQEAMSGAGSSPGITSPFAALANSPHEDADATLAGETAFEAEQMRQEQQQHEQQPSADGAVLQPSSFGSDQYADAANHQTSDLQPNSEEGLTRSHDDNIGSEQEADMQSASSGGSRQNHRRKGRPKCVVM